MNGHVPYLVEAHVTARREEMLAEAKRMRVLIKTSTRVPGSFRRHFGALLVAAGERLHGPANQPCLQPAC